MRRSKEITRFHEQIGVPPRGRSLIGRAVCIWLLAWMAGALAIGAEPLRPEEAFRASAHALDGGTIEARFTVAAGYYLYRDKFRFALESAERGTPSPARIGTPVFPKGRETEDETFGKVEVYDDDAAIRLPVERDASRASGPLSVTLQITLQGCAELGICYPPQKYAFAVDLPAPASAPPAIPSSAPATRAATAEGDEPSRLARLLGESSPGWAMLCFFGFGLLLSLTPCVLPMLPILSGIVVGAGRGGPPVSRGRALALSIAYVLGMAVVYAAAGVAAGLSGALVSGALQNIGVLGAFALLFVFLALPMFGLFELRLPAFLQGRARENAGRPRASLAGVALMGALSALLVAPCVVAPLAGALLYIGGTGDALLGALALFCLALGMGTPLVAVGVSAGALLPRAGPWTNAVNRFFGFLMLACALWIVAPFIPVSAQMAGWAALLIVPAVFLRALDPLPPDTTGWPRLGKAIGLLLLLFGMAQLAGALSGARDPLRPLAAFGSSGGAEIRALPFERVRTPDELDRLLATAGKPVLLDFYADWCASCREMERDTFSDPRVREKLAGWRLLQADVTENTPDDQALLRRFKLYGPPGIVLFDPSGKEIPGVRIVGYQAPERFLGSLAASDDSRESAWPPDVERSRSPPSVNR